MKNSKEQRALIVFFPSILMLVISFLSFSNFEPIKTLLDWAGIFILSLLLLFPVFFLIQGIAAANKHINIFIALGTSVLTFFIVTMLYLNSTALIYILIYSIAGMIGFGGTKFIRKYS